MTRKRRNTKIVHRAKSVREDGSVSAVCFRSPRAIDMSRASWSTTWDAVTCKPCLAKRIVLPGDERGDPAQRWRALSPRTQWAALFDLHTNIKIREYKLAHWADSEVDKGALRESIELDRALLALLQSVTPEDVFADAKKIGERP